MDFTHEHKRYYLQELITVIDEQMLSVFIVQDDKKRIVYAGSNPLLSPVKLPMEFVRFGDLKVGDKFSYATYAFFKTNIERNDDGCEYNGIATNIGTRLFDDEDLVQVKKDKENA